MKNSNDRILKALAIIISINLVVYGVASTASASLLDIAEENEWADEDVPYEDYDDEDDFALLFADASVAEVDTYEEGTGLITGGFANSGGGIFNVGSIQILGSNSIRDNESDQGPDNVFQMHGAVMDNEFYPKSEHP